MQKHVNLVDLVKSFPTNIYLQNLASIQKRTSPVKFVHLAEKSGNGSISNLSTKVKASCTLVNRRSLQTYSTVAFANAQAATLPDSIVECETLGGFSPDVCQLLKELAEVRDNRLSKAEYDDTTWAARSWMS